MGVSQVGAYGIDTDCCKQVGWLAFRVELFRLTVSLLCSL